MENSTLMLSALTAESDSNKLTTSTSGFSDRATVVRSMYFWNADEAYIAIGTFEGWASPSTLSEKTASQNARCVPRTALKQP